MIGLVRGVEEIIDVHFYSPTSVGGNILSPVQKAKCMLTRQFRLVCCLQSPAKL